MDYFMKVANSWWNCPLGDETNTWGVKDMSNGYQVDIEGRSSKGAIGVVILEVSRGMLSSIF